MFSEQIGREVELPRAPERLRDPKATLDELLSSRRPSSSFFALFGEQVGFSALRRLPAFASFEDELSSLIRSFGHG